MGMLAGDDTYLCPGGAPGGAGGHETYALPIESTPPAARPGVPFGRPSPWAPAQGEYILLLFVAIRLFYNLSLGLTRTPLPSSLGVGGLQRPAASAADPEKNIERFGSHALKLQCLN